MVDHGVSLGERACIGDMVVSDNNSQPQFLCPVNTGKSGDAIINSQNDLSSRPLGHDLVYANSIDTKAARNPVVAVAVSRHIQTLESKHGCDASGDTIDIVVVVDSDLFLVSHNIL